MCRNLASCVTVSDFWHVSQLGKLRYSLGIFLLDIIKDWLYITLERKFLIPKEFTEEMMLSRIASILIMLTLLIFISNCSSDHQKLTAEQEQQIKRIGEASAMALMKNLKSHLTEAMEAGEPVESLEICATKAISLTEEIQTTLQPGMTIKRTSFKFRNPANAPDSLEETALDYFETVKQTGEALPEFYIQTIEDNNEYRYYKPMKMAALCLNCHGKTDQLDLAFRTSLKTNYPEDLAVDYQVDDFRGVIRVSIPAELVGN